MIRTKCGDRLGTGSASRLVACRRRRVRPRYVLDGLIIATGSGTRLVTKISIPLQKVS